MPNRGSMKKGIIVLLITVLAAGMAFATFEGSAALSFGYKLDEKVWGFKNSKDVTYEFKFTFDTQSASVGTEHQTSIWAELEASGSAAIKGDKEGAAYDISASISKANIHIDDITIGILNAGGEYSYAKAYYKTDGSNFDDAVKLGKEKANGFTVEYAGYKTGFGLEGKADKFKMFGQAQSKEFTFAEGITAQAAAYGFIDNGLEAEAKEAGASVKGAYKSDALNADAAVDFVYVGENKLSFEAATNVTYAPVTLSVYYLTNDGKFEKHNLDAKISAVVSLEDVKITPSVDVRNIINDDRNVTGAVKVEAGAITANASVGYNVSLDKKDAATIKGLKIAGDVTYKVDMLTAKAGVAVGLEKKAGADKLSYYGIKPSASISSTAIVEGAELSLGYAGANFVAEEATQIGTASKGAITAAVTIEF